MPQEPERERNRVKRRGDAHGAELLFQHQRERSREGEQCIAVQREQQADQDRGDLRGDVAGELACGKRAVDQRDGRKRIDGDVVGGGEASGAWLALGEGMAGADEGGELVVEQLERADVRRL